jgi:hypothetical protein
VGVAALGTRAGGRRSRFASPRHGHSTDDMPVTLTASSGVARRRPDVSDLCRYVRRACSSLLRMTPGSWSGHDFERQDPGKLRSRAAQSDAGTARPCPPRSQAWRLPCRLAAERRLGVRGGMPGATATWSFPERDRGVGTLAGGPYAPSHSCPRTPTGPSSKGREPENSG